MNGHPSVSHTFGPLSGAPPQTNTAAHGTTFAFRKRYGQIDWRSLASVDVDRIAREMDFQSLQQNIMNVTFCNVESEEFYNVDHNFTKLFRLAQLIIEYLLHCQQYLSEQASESEQRAQEMNQELEQTKSELSSQTVEMKTVKKENRKRKKIVQAYQDMLNAGATGIHSCPVCKREFVSKEYLQSHIHRRHPEHSLASQQVEAKSVLSQEELEKKLMEQMTERLQATETQLKEDMHTKECEAHQKQVEDFGQWKASEKERLELELRAFKEPILSELRTAQREKSELEKVVLQKQAEIEILLKKKQSNLGHLEDARELDIGGSQRRQEELEQVKQHLESKVDELQSSMKKQEKSWKNRLRKVSTSHQDQADSSAQKLSQLEQNFQESTNNDKTQSALKKQLLLLKKKVKEQEDQLNSHRQELTVLQSREPTVTPPPTSPVRVLESPPPQQRGNRRVQIQEYIESDSESGTDEADGSLYYTPLPHRPMIKTKFDHSPDVLANIKKETESILSEALQQRGMPEGQSGLKKDDFTAKMSSLELERQQRVQTSYQFVEHRDRLVQEIDDITHTEFAQLQDQSRHSHTAPHSTRSKGHAAADLPNPSANKKPPLPTHRRLSSSQPDPGRSTGTSSQPDPGRSTGTKPAPHTPSQRQQQQGTVTRVKPQNSESESEIDSLTSLTATPEPVRKTPPPVTTLSAGEQESPWDSEDDSIEALVAAPYTAGRTSSTPIKGASGGSQPRQLLTPPPVSVITVAATNPSKRPIGGVPVFHIPSVDNTQQDDENSFDISDQSYGEPTAVTSLKGANLKSSLYGKDSITHSLNPPTSRTVTSQSPLTTVTLGDFADSDFSDLDL